VTNESEPKIQRKINKKFSSLIESSKKFKITTNEVSEKHSKQESTA
jgi:hypothetical protein